MFPVEIRSVKIGEGIPKVCAPIVGRSKDDILAQAELISRLPLEIVEWRADHFELVNNICEVQDVLNELREILGNKIILFTYRTKEEGGNGEFYSDEYRSLNLSILDLDVVDMIDIEAFNDKYDKNEIINKAKKQGIKLIFSYHNFETTPPKEELISRMCQMQEMQADIVKIAVMPESEEDVSTLMYATREMFLKYAKCPLVTISMGKLGVVSRMCGESFGSAISFGNVGQPSAPGQIDAEELFNILRKRHENI